MGAGIVAELGRDELRLVLAHVGDPATLKQCSTALKVLQIVHMIQLLLRFCELSLNNSWIFILWTE